VRCDVTVVTGIREIVLRHPTLAHFEYAHTCCFVCLLIVSPWEHNRALTFTYPHFTLLPPSTSPTPRSFANFECNATAPMKITQHFAKLMVDKKLKGLIAFTSSSAGECCLACSARLVCKHVFVFSFIFYGC
jgi:hypothetical protein